METLTGLMVIMLTVLAKHIIMLRFSKWHQTQSKSQTAGNVISFIFGPMAGEGRNHQSYEKQICILTFIVIHPINKTFHSEPQMLVSWWL